MTAVPVLLTCDIHTHNYTSAQVHEDLVRARAALKSLHLPCTFFFPSTSAQALRADVDALRSDGHEIGCHGLTHGPAEQLDLLPPMAQRACLARATSDLTALLGVPPASFRAPTFKVSGPTMAVLDELEYRADLSVVSQRLGVFGSDIYSAGPLMAPRRPYHPSRRNPFRRGESRVWEIPLSACVLPFLSNTERLCGLAFMRVFFRCLHAEARVTGKPIVFMFHAEDLNPDRGVQQFGPPSWRDFVPTRANGFRFRHFLLERDWRRVSEDLMALFSHIASASSVRFLTVRDYLPELERRATPVRSDRP